METIVSIASKAAREAAREAIAEVLGAGGRHLVPVPEPEPTPPTPKAELEGQLSESVARYQVHANRVADARAAADLFISEMVTADGAAPKGWVSFPDLLTAYEEWRPGIDAPEVSKRLLAEAMTRAGHTNRRQARATDHERFRPAGSMRPTLYFGIRLRAPKGVPAPRSEDAPPPQWMSSDTETKRDSANGYIGQWPGREIPNDFRNKIVIPILRSGKGWVYKKANGNGAGKPRLISPEGQVFTLPNTPSDWRAVRNTTASLRRLGLAGVI